jgi:hypothetical protein
MVSKLPPILPETFGATPYLLLAISNGKWFGRPSGSPMATKLTKIGHLPAQIDPGQGLARSLAEKDRAAIRTSLKIVTTFSK